MRLPYAILSEGHDAMLKCVVRKNVSLIVYCPFLGDAANRSVFAVLINWLHTRV